MRCEASQGASQKLPCSTIHLFMGVGQYSFTGVGICPRPRRYLFSTCLSLWNKQLVGRGHGTLGLGPFPGGRQPQGL